MVKLLSLYWVFMMKSSHDKAITDRLSGINREQEYLLIGENKTVNIWYIPSVSNIILMKHYFSACSNINICKI